MSQMDTSRVLIPIDFSETSDLALDTGVELARRLGATEIVLVHVFVPPSTWGLDGALLDFPEVEQAMREEVQKALDERAARVRAAGLVVMESIVEGRPAEGILRAAEQHAPGLIVMGTHGRTGLGHVLLGSVAERVVQKAHRPVLVIPPPAPRKA